MTDIFVRRSVNGLVPVDAEGEAVFQQWALNTVVKVAVTRPRNIAFHRKFFALLNVGFEHQEAFGNFESYRKAIIIDSGYFKAFRLLDGSMHFEAQSIAFAKMTEDDFSKMYKNAIDSVLKLLHGSTEDEINAAVDEVLGF